MQPPANLASGSLVLTQPARGSSLGFWAPLGRQRCKLKLAGGLSSLLGGPTFLGQLLNFFELLFVYLYSEAMDPGSKHRPEE